MTTYKDLCSDCTRVTVCHFWLDLLKQENTRIVDHFQDGRISTIRIVYACGDYEKPIGKLTFGTRGAFVSGYKPYIDKDKHEPETIAEMITDKDY